MKSIKIKIGNNTVWIKAAWMDSEADKKTTYFFFNTLSLYARMAAEKWEKEGGHAIAEEALEFADAFYDYLDKRGHYEHCK